MANMVGDTESATPDHMPRSRPADWGGYFSRLLLAVGLTAALVSELFAYLTYAGQGEPSAPELLEAFGFTERILAVDLKSIPATRGHRPVRLSPAWFDESGEKDAPRLLVFVDGRSVPFVPDIRSAWELPQGSWAYYRDPATRTLRIVCSPMTACESLLAVRSDLPLWPEILRLRALGSSLRRGTVVCSCLLVFALLWRLTRGRFTAWSLLAVVPVLTAIAELASIFWTRAWFRDSRGAYAILLTAALGGIAWLGLRPYRWVLGKARPSQRLLFPLAVAGVLAYACWFTVVPEWTFNLGTDEGLYMHGAQRMLAGQVPNRDFFSFIPPGSYAALAAAGWIRGRVLAVDARLVAAMCALATALAYACVLQPRPGRPRATLYTLSVALAIGNESGPGSYFSFSHHSVSLFWAALAILCFVPSLRNDRPVSAREAILAGLATSCALMTTTNLGVYLAVALLGWLVIDHAIVDRKAGVAFVSAAFSVCAASLPSLYILYHFLIGNGRRLYQELVEFVFVNYAAVNAGKLDYFFFFRMRINAAYQQFVSGGPVLNVLTSVLETGVVFLGHFLVLVVAARKLAGWWRGREERAECRATLLLGAMYLASIGTAVSNPFFSNVRTHALPAYVVLIGWVLNRALSVLSRTGVGLRIETVAAAVLVVWVTQLPNWRTNQGQVLATPLGDLTYHSAALFNDERQVLELLESKGDALSLVAYHYLAPRWYAYFPKAQRLRFAVLVPFYSPTEHYQQALEAVKAGRITYVVEDHSLQDNKWDPRVRFTSLFETNGAMFYSYVRRFGRAILSNRTFTIWELPSAERAGPAAQSVSSSKRTAQTLEAQRR